jgi:hypothetical protein
MIIRDELVGKLKLLLKINQPGDGDETLKIHLENVAYSLSQEFDSLVSKQAVLTADADGVITFPADVHRVIGLWVGDTEIQPVDWQDFQRYTQVGVYNDIVRVQERAGRWIGTLSGRNTTEDTEVTLIYKANFKDIGNFPEYYQRLIMLKAANDYYVYEGAPVEMIARIKKEAETEMGRCREMQTHGTHLQVRRKSQFELDWNRALRSLVFANDRDVN